MLVVLGYLGLALALQERCTDLGGPHSDAQWGDDLLHPPHRCLRGHHVNHPVF